MPETVSLAFRKNPTKIDSIVLDCTLNETHTRTIDITEHPVEEGSNISDHARVKQKMLTLGGLVSNTPINRTQQLRVVESRGYKFASATEQDNPAGTAGYAETAADKLEEIADTKKLIIVFTRQKVYDNMLIESLVMPRDRTSGDALHFTVTFKQIKIVRNRSTKKTVAKEPKAQAKVKAGKQTTPAATEAQKKKSIAYSTAEKLGLLEKLGIKAK